MTSPACNFQISSDDKLSINLAWPYIYNNVAFRDEKDMLIISSWLPMGRCTSRHRVGHSMVFLTDLHVYGLIVC